MTQASQVPFGEWLPDLPAHDNPGALIALNVVPQLNSYRGLNSLSAFSNALANVCLGSFWARSADNTVFNFASDVNALYELDAGTTWLDISGLSAPFSANNWDFTKFGERILAVNSADPMQKYDMVTDAVFSDQPGTPPNSKYIATVRDFVMIGNIPSLGPNFVKWSGFNNSEIWTPSLATQADEQELFGRGGQVQRIVPGDYAVIFTEQSIWRADYVGPPVIFQFDEAVKKRGTPAPNSVVWQGDNVFFWGWDNFYVYDGRQAQPISHNRVSKWFQQNAAADAWDSIRGAIDRINRLVIWAFRTNASAPINNRLIIYNWGADKWSYAEVETQVIDEYVAPGFTLDELDVPLPGGIDVDSILVDSDQFTGGNIGVQAFDALNQSATFNGTPLQSTIDTKELSGPNHRRIMCNSVRPLVEASGATTISLQVGKRNQLTDNPVFSTLKGQNGRNGEINVRENSRYQRYRLTIDGGFEHANGVKANIREAGRSG